MAEFNVEGMDELSSAFMRHEEGAEAAVQEMLTATAEIYVQEQKAEAGGYRIRKTGGFMNSIKASTIRRDGTALVCDICPEGKADHPAEYGGGSNKRKGKSRRGNVRYATIGFIFEYGTSSAPVVYTRQCESGAERLRKGAGNMEQVRRQDVRVGKGQQIAWQHF